MLPGKEVAFERVLEMAWMQIDDVFTFSLHCWQKVRNLLVMSIYDPLDP